MSGERSADAPAGALVGPRAPLLATSAERLDRLLLVSSSLTGTALAALVLAMIAAIVWSVRSSAPVKVEAQGIVLSRQGVGDVTADAEGRVTALRIAVGDRLQVGQVVAELSQPAHGDRARSKQLELDGLRAQRDELQVLTDRTFAAAEAQRALRRQALEVRAAALTQRMATLRNIEASTIALFASGVATRLRALEATNERSRAENDLNDVASQMLVLRSESEEGRAQNEREALKSRLAVAVAERELDVLRASMSRSNVVLARAEGTVTEVNVNLGDQVQPGMPLARVLLGTARPSDLQVVVFVPGGGGKRVHPGMAVQVVPATARLQRDGFIEGRVVSVAELPASKESMQRILKNDAFVAALTKAGPPYEAVVALDTDPRSPSGFRWSTGQGPAAPLGAGTMAEAKIVVDRLPVIALVIPRAETVLGALRRWAVPAGMAAPATGTGAGASAPP